MAYRLSPLDRTHRDLDAKMVPFGGWEMPLSYPPGTLAEHKACRHGAALFDVSHLGTVHVAGEGALELLQTTFTNDLRKVHPGRAQYTHLLDPEDGSVTDDIIVWWLDDDMFDVMPNASNTDGVINALAGGDLRIHIEDVTENRALLAVQGPSARRILAEVSPEAADVGRFRVEQIAWDGAACTVAGTGYTGEDGVEISIPAQRAEDLWDALMDAGAEPAGLGARDTLRLEAGLPLHGHELGPGITPLQAGLEWVVSWEKGDFRGRQALATEREAGPRRVIRGLVTDSRRPPREGQTVRRDGAPIGAVTSGNFSPGLGKGVALALLAADATEGQEVTIEARGNELPARITKPPFVP